MVNYFGFRENFLATARFLVLLFGFFSVTNTTFAQSLNASLDRNITSVGDSLTLSLTFEGGAPSSLPSFPQIPNLQINFAGQKRQSVIQNGRQSHSLVLTYRITPSAEGEFSIPQILIPVNGQPLQTPPLNFRVIKAAQQENGPFLKIVVPKHQVYLGELLPIEIRIYAQEGRWNQLPDIRAEGFTIAKLAEHQRGQTELNGQLYHVVIYKATITPVKLGKMDLGPATLPLIIPYRSKTPQHRDPFDPFGVFNGGGVNWREVQLQSEPVSLDIIPLPSQNVPKTFNGAIGSFTWNVEAAPSQLAVGDPITIKARIEGRGTIESLKLSEQQWRDFKFYPANSRLETIDPLGWEGAKLFEQVVTPQNAEIKELPRFEFTYFDPEQQTYLTLSSPKIPLHVRPSVAGLSSGFLSSSETSNKANDIAHIHPELGTLRNLKKTESFQSTTFWVIHSSAPILLMGSTLLRLNRERRSKNPKARRERETQNKIRLGLEELKRQAAANQSDAFFETAYHLLQTQIGDRINQPASAITEAVLDTELRMRGLPSSLVAQIHELFDACNQARFSPTRNRDDLNKFVPKLELALSELKKIEPERAPTLAVNLK